jgi:hypothetical protein
MDFQMEASDAVLKFLRFASFRGVNQDLGVREARQ